MSENDKSKTEELRDIFMEAADGQTEVTEEQEEDLGRDLSGDEADARPTTSVNCPECGHDTAYYHMKQIRAADESETRFFECTKCGQKWREDDH